MFLGTHRYYDDNIYDQSLPLKNWKGARILIKLSLFLYEIRKANNRSSLLAFLQILCWPNETNVLDVQFIWVLNQFLLMNQSKRFTKLHQNQYYLTPDSYFRWPINTMFLYVVIFCNLATIKKHLAPECVTANSRLVIYVFLRLGLVISAKRSLLPLKPQCKCQSMWAHTV